MLSSLGSLVIFLSSTVSRPALGPTQPPIRWIPHALSPGVKRPGREADHSRPSSTDVKNAWRYISTPPIRLHGMMLRIYDIYIQLVFKDTNRVWNYISFTLPAAVIQLATISISSRKKSRNIYNLVLRRLIIDAISSIEIIQKVNYSGS
jgi:hypothetical protein